MTLVTPRNAKGPVPVMIMFSSAAMRQFIASHPEFKKMMGTDPPSTEQLIAGGWGYALLDTSSIQADNGSGLTKGIIGLTNKGQARKPEDWGALRAWGWGASRGFDYLRTDKSVDAKRVGIEGVSRYGKAALVTMAFDTRFAVVLVGSSGEGGVKPHRRNFGEEVEHLTGSGGYHWMYVIPRADKSFDYHQTPCDLPADQPVFRTDANSLVAHSQLLAKAKQGGIDIYLEGDSITRRWGAIDCPDLLANWKQTFFGW